MAGRPFRMGINPMTNLTNFDSFEDYCKALAARLAAVRGDPSPGDWAELASDSMVITQALIFFCELAENEMPAPSWLMKFIAGGVKQHLRNEAPWPVRVGRPPSPPIFAAMVQYINERFPRRLGKIATHLDASLDTVSRRNQERSGEITRLLAVFRARRELAEADFNGLLLELDKALKAAESTRPVLERVREAFIASALRGKTPD